MSNLTNTGSGNTFKLCPCAANLKYTDLSPYNERNGNTVTRVFVRKLMEMLLDHIRKTYDRNENLIEWHQPEEMENIMDLKIPCQSLPLQQLLNDCHQTLKFHVKSGHPRFFNQLSNGLDLVSLCGEFLTSVCNVNTFTYEIASIFLIMERVVFKRMREIIGWPDGAGDTILTPGGSIANLYAVLCARHKKYPDYKEKGTKCLPGELVMYTSSCSHYSVMRSAVICGFGLNNCVQVPVDKITSRMIPEELEKLVKETQASGKIPFFCVCTLGTTVHGAFDPINPIADICAKYGMWLHCDAAWGGGILMSKTLRQGRFDGVERTDSITWNPHKLMGVLLQCSTIHLKEDGILLACNAMKAKYLFMDDKAYDVKYDTGDKTIQCGRRNDVFKLWLTWRAKGDSGYENHINRLVELTQYFVKKLKEQPDKFIVINDPEMVNTCFWYMSKRLRDMPDSPEKELEMGKLCPKIKLKMMEAGTTMCAYQQDDFRPNFFRHVISSASATEKDLDFFIAEIDRLGEML